MTKNLKQEAVNKIENLFNNYQDEKIQETILKYINKELPERIKLVLDREARKQLLETNAESYINEFLINSENKYAYIPRTEIFINYDGKNFKIENESNILYNILAGISKKRDLEPWKHKIKNTIIKKVRDTNFFSVIPESNTIQQILQFFTKTLFPNKDISKYFLTIIGDNILKKQTNIIHLADNCSKSLLYDLEYYICDYFKNIYHCIGSFKFSPNNYDSNICRIVTFAPLVEKKDIWYNFVKTNFLNIISVSVYYSNRYNNSENFINLIQSATIVNKINFLKDNTSNEIVINFIKDINIINVDNSDISLKEMQYLWKIFLNKNEFPYIIFLSTAMKELKQKFEFKNNRFLNIKSSHLENIKVLNTFWGDFMVKEDNEELEVSELCDLYNGWIQFNNNTLLPNFLIDEDFFINYISNFCDIEIKGKVIENFKCILWEKKNETEAIIEDLKLKYKYNENFYESSIDSLYSDYCNTCKNEYNYRIVSKNWFTKYINQVIPEKYINKNRILNAYWKT